MRNIQVSLGDLFLDKKKSHLDFQCGLKFIIQKNKNEIIRDLEVSLYQNGRFLRKMIQAQSSINAEEVFQYGDNGIYSFLIEPQTIKRFDLLFILGRKDLNENFDTIKIGYYNVKDEHVEYLLDKVNGDWNLGENPIDNDWKLLV
ncbi:hypothetical protein [Streptococcus orisasini]|uniref:hypothetical protein n=1 Tax=Streptococcus orisasini TaxID=1080071 RepID=UPI00070F1082|nr:hypothetical protein [Streptococcus orisasini]